MVRKDKYEEGDMQFTERSRQGPYDSGSYKVKEMFIFCPKCQIGRWIVAATVFNAGFSGLCAKCTTDIIDSAFGPYRNAAKVIALRTKYKLGRERH